MKNQSLQKGDTIITNRGLIAKVVELHNDRVTISFGQKTAILYLTQVTKCENTIALQVHYSLNDADDVYYITVYFNRHEVLFDASKQFEVCIADKVKSIIGKSVIVKSIQIP